MFADKTMKGIEVRCRLGLIFQVIYYFILLRDKNLNK